MSIYLKNTLQYCVFFKISLLQWPYKSGQSGFWREKNWQPFCKTKFVEEKKISTNYNIFEINLRLNQF